MGTWNSTTHSLPANQEHVQFIVTGHRAWLFGSFDGGCFRSRWATYPTTGVNLWRTLDDELELPGFQRIMPDMLYWSERRAGER